MGKKKLIAMISTEGLDKEEMIKKATEAVDRFKAAQEKEEAINQQFLSDEEKAFNQFLQSIEFPIKKKKYDSDGSERKMAPPMRMNKNGLPALSSKLLNLVFGCVYGMPNEEEIRKRSYLAPLRNLEENDQLMDSLNLIEKLSMYNYWHRWKQYHELYEIAEPILGPFETNSEGTSLWLARILAIKELYGLTTDELKAVLRKITIRI